MNFDYFCIYFYTFIRHKSSTKKGGKFHTKNNSFYDAPGIPINILLQNYVYFRVRMTFDLYLMYKPKGKENERLTGCQKRKKDA